MWDPGTSGPGSGTRAHTYTGTASSAPSCLAPVSTVLSVFGVDGDRDDWRTWLDATGGRDAYNTLGFNLGRNLADVRHDKQVISSSASIPAARRTKHPPTSYDKLPRCQRDRADIPLHGFVHGLKSNQTDLRGVYSDEIRRAFIWLAAPCCLNSDVWNHLFTEWF